MKRLVLTLTMLTAAVGAGAQIPAAPPSGSLAQVEVDPIRCWWRTSAGAVRIGEAFDLSLTCATLENDAVQVVADESHLDASVAAMAPFEVIGGSHPADLRSGQRRFFQYQYTLRIISPDAIGRDVRLPETSIHYKVNSRIAANTALQGRDLVYFLPAQSIRVASMVPADATDIRDQAGENFAVVDTLRLRAGTLEIAAAALVALGALTTVLVVVGLVRRRSQRTPADERALSFREVASAAVRELSAVRRAREDEGWTDALTNRALAATRLVASAALARPVSQRLAGGRALAGAGRVKATSPLRRKARMLSSALTPEDLTHELSHPSPADPAAHDTIERLRDSLTVLSLSRYGRSAPLDQGSLDEALANSLEAAARVKASHSWIRTASRRLRPAAETDEESQA